MRGIDHLTISPLEPFHECVPNILVRNGSSHFSGKGVLARRLRQTWAGCHEECRSDEKVFHTRRDIDLRSR